ncbi:hypothetical protein A9Q96_00755 [Rhodobacterales bacterium 52_120_T64]|nr:hypothetical protein A9Q96_00755 [Rhodobacterales bacterium 52_120_T64]
MNADTREKYLKLALAVFGLIFLLIYPLGIIWPSGWVWHGGEGSYYLQMIIGMYLVLGVMLIMASRNPSEHKSLINYTIWSSIVHGLIMGVQAVGDDMEHGHLIADVPALLLVAAVLWYLSPKGDAAEQTA